MWGISYYPSARNKGNKKQEEGPFWKKRIESNINALHKNVSLIERWKIGMLRKEHQKARPDCLYRDKSEEYKRVE